MPFVKGGGGSFGDEAGYADSNFRHVLAVRFQDDVIVISAFLLFQIFHGEGIDFLPGFLDLLEVPLNIGSALGLGIGDGNGVIVPGNDADCLFYRLSCGAIERNIAWLDGDDLGRRDISPHRNDNFVRDLAGHDSNGILVSTDCLPLVFHNQGIGIPFGVLSVGQGDPYILPLIRLRPGNLKQALRCGRDLYRNLEGLIDLAIQQDPRRVNLREFLDLACNRQF